MAARILAFVAAIAMVGGALAYRASQESGGSGGAGPSSAAAVVCAAELQAACDAIPGATIEPAGTTADRLLKARNVADANIRAWLAPGPWAQMVDETRAQQSKPRLFSKYDGVANTDLIAVVKSDKLPAGCAASVTWKCLGDAAQEKAFLVSADPKDSPSGLLIRAALLTGFFGRTNYASNDFEESQPWLDNVEARISEASAKGATDLTRFLRAAPEVSAFLTTRQAASSFPGIVVPAPPSAIPATLATATGARDSGVDRGKVTKALTEAGWKAGPVAGSGGLPSPGVLLALRERLI